MKVKDNGPFGDRTRQWKIVKWWMIPIQKVHTFRLPGNHPFLYVHMYMFNILYIYIYIYICVYIHTGVIDIKLLLLSSFFIGFVSNVSS